MAKSRSNAYVTYENAGTTFAIQNRPLPEPGENYDNEDVESSNYKDVVTVQTKPQCEEAVEAKPRLSKRMLAILVVFALLFLAVICSLTLAAKAIKELEETKSDIVSLSAKVDMESLKVESSIKQIELDIQQNEQNITYLSNRVDFVSSDLANLSVGVDMESLKVESSLKQLELDIQEVNNSVRIVDRKIVSRDIRLFDFSKGTVEVFKDGTWGTICDDGWDLNDAHVICRMLGFNTAIAAPMLAYYGQGTGPIFMDDVRCTGTESNIWSCPHIDEYHEDCGHHEDAGVECV